MTTIHGPRLAALTGAGLLAGSLTLAITGPATAAETTATVATSAEAWYHTQACTSPIGCPPEPVPTAASTYPAGTLHVGVFAGQPSTHAYVKLDLDSALPFDATLTSGTLTLPVSQDPQAGNSQVETAKLVACPATEPVTDGVEGGTTKAPGYNCDTAQSPAQLAADGKTFTIHLNPLITAGTDELKKNGIALVPATEQEQGAGWQVTLTGKKAEATPKISAIIGYTATDDDTGTGTATPPDTGGFEAPPIPAAPDLPAPPVADVPAPPITDPGPPPATAPEPTQPASLTSMPWYAYRGVVYLPLAFLVGIFLMGRTLTRPLTAPTLRLR